MSGASVLLRSRFSDSQVTSETVSNKEVTSAQLLTMSVPIMSVPSQEHLTTIRAIGLAFLLGFLGSCIPQRSSPPSPIPRTQQPKPPTVSSTIDSVLLESTYLPGRVQYTIQLQTVTEATPADEAHPPDSTQTTGIAVVEFVAYSIAESSASISVDSLRLTTTGSTSQQLRTHASQALIDLRTSRVSALLPVIDPLKTCTSETADAPISGIELIPRIPLPVSLSWADTTQLHVCRNGVLLTIQRVSTYHSISRNLLTRSSRATIVGSGIQWNQAVTITGQGIGEDTISLGNTSPRRIDQISGRSRLDISFTSTLRTQHFTQTTTTVLTRQQ